jgi:hypothetical protein
MARSAPADYREFIRLSVDLPDNPKLAMIDDPAAGWAYVVALCYCGRNFTDGAFPMTPVVRQAGVRPATARKLVNAGLWHESGHSCERCPQPMPGMAVVHDYLEHQRSADEARSLRDARREAGRKGAASRWDGNGHGNGHGNGDGKSPATGMATGSQTDDRAMPELEGEEELEKKTSSSSGESGRKRPATRLPDAWRPTENHRRYSSEHGLELETQRQLFAAHAEANDRRCASWNGAFTQWLIKADEIQRSRRGRLRAVSGGHQPWQNPADQSEYDDPMFPTEESR